MKYNFQFLLLVVVISLVSCERKKSKTETKNDRKQIDDYSVKIDSLIQTTNPRIFNGVILITKNGETKYSKAFGYSNYELKTPITVDDNFRIQSNSKQVTAVVLLKEVENGKIDLRSPINKYLPDFKQTWADTVTVHQLLNMSSGIIALDKPLKFKPGTDYTYSNPGYALLGQIIEKVTEKTFIEIVNNLFKQLGMHNSYCYEIGKPNHNLINGYWISNGVFKPVDFNNWISSKEQWKDFIPAGGIISNLHELNIWDTKLHKGEILKPQSYNLMINYDNTGQHDAFGNDKIGYGYGLRIHDKGLIKHMGHAGRGIGFASIKFYIPEKDVDVIVLENVYNEDVQFVYHFENEIRKIVLKSNLVK